MTSSGSGQFQVVVNAGTELNNPTLGKLFITTVGISVPEIVNNTMKHHLEVNGTIKIIEAMGTVANANNGSTVLDHENNGGSASITFRSKANRESDYGYIQYQDASVVNGCGESARLIIGTQNDVDNHIIFAPSGNVGIGNNDPTQKLIVQGNIQTNGAIYATSDIYAGPAYNGGFYSGHSNWGFEISNFSGQYWTEARGYWHQSGRGFGCVNLAYNSDPFVVDFNNCVGIGIENPSVGLQVENGGVNTGFVCTFFANTTHDGRNGSLGDTVFTQPFGLGHQVIPELRKIYKI